MIDLHTHTNCSDGADTYKELLIKAEKQGLTYLSITDHDTCKVYEQMKEDNIKKYYTGTLIQGVELQAYVLGTSIELLGYGVNPDKINQGVKKLYRPFEEINKIEMERLYQRCISVGMQFDEEVLEKYNTSNIYYGTEYLHQEMRKYPENRKYIQEEDAWKSESAFFRKYTSNTQSSFYIDESDLIPSAEKVAQFIQEAGGLVFIPHIYQYGEKSNTILEYIIANCHIDGIECFYPTFTQEQTEYLLAFCKQKCKYISGGSDYHGSNRPGTQIGTGINGNLVIEEEIIKDWKEKVIKKRK